MFVLQTRKSYAVHFKSWRHISDSPASGYPGAFKLINIHHSVTFVKIFLHRFISEVSRFNICKFDQIASNSLQVIKKLSTNFLTAPRTYKRNSGQYVCQIHHTGNEPVYNNNYNGNNKFISRGQHIWHKCQSNIWSSITITNSAICDWKVKSICSIYRADEVSVHRECCERASQPYSFGG